MDRMILELLPYVTSYSECTKAEATTMIGLVYMAMIQKMLSVGRVNLPIGNMVFSVAPKQKYPLRVKVYTPYPIVRFLNVGDNAETVAVSECMIPVNYEQLKALQQKAWEYKEEKQKEHDGIH